MTSKRKSSEATRMDVRTAATYIRPEHWYGTWNVVVLVFCPGVPEPTNRCYGWVDRKDDVEYDFLVARTDGQFEQFAFARRGADRDYFGKSLFGVCFGNESVPWVAERLVRTGFPVYEESRDARIDNDEYESFVLDCVRRTSIIWMFWFRMPPRSIPKMFDHFFGRA